MRRFLSVALILAAMTCTAQAYLYSDYTWLEYNGHQYAPTFTWSTWSDAQSEAAANGWNLVTVNDESENMWLAAQNFYGPEGESDSRYRGAWIGLHKVSDDWSWVSGEPVTFLGTWVVSGGDYAYLHSVGHAFVEGGTWGSAPWVGTLHGIHGIIEIPAVPVPGAVILAVLGLGTAGMRLRRRLM